MDEERVIPVIAEELEIEKRAVRTGAVRVAKNVEEHTEVVDLPLIHEMVEIRRVVLNQRVDRIPESRQEGDVTIIPVVEEVLFVEKRLMLKEEIHLIKTRTTERTAQEVVLRREHAEVHRVNADGDAVVVEPQSEAAPPISAAAFEARAAFSEDPAGAPRSRPLRKNKIITED